MTTGVLLMGHGTHDGAGDIVPESFADPVLPEDLRHER